MARRLYLSIIHLTFFLLAFVNFSKGQSYYSLDFVENKGQWDGNFKYRAEVGNGAFFIDAGNIWLLHKDAVYTDAEFKVDRFVQEFAIGSGIGARLDFSFFIIRFDLGVKLRDPQFNGTDRWVIQYFFDDKWNANYRNLGRGDYPFLNFNLGIGYPF